MLLAERALSRIPLVAPHRWSPNPGLASRGKLYPLCRGLGRTVIGIRIVGLVLAGLVPRILVGAGLSIVGRCFFPSWPLGLDYYYRLRKGGRGCR